LNAGSFEHLTSELRTDPKRLSQASAARGGRERRCDFSKDETHLFLNQEPLDDFENANGTISNYEAVLPKENNRIVVLRERLGSAIKRVALLR
jgi:hypothetical protein